MFVISQYCSVSDRQCGGVLKSQCSNLEVAHVGSCLELDHANGPLLTLPEPIERARMESSHVYTAWVLQTASWSRSFFTRRAASNTSSGGSSHIS